MGVLPSVEHRPGAILWGIPEKKAADPRPGAGRWMSVAGRCLVAGVAVDRIVHLVVARGEISADGVDHGRAGIRRLVNRDAVVVGAAAEADTALEAVRMLGSADATPARG